MAQRIEAVEAGVQNNAKKAEFNAGEVFQSLSDKIKEVEARFEEEIDTKVKKSENTIVNILNAHINDSVKQDLDKLVDRQAQDVERVLSIYRNSQEENLDFMGQLENKIEGGLKNLATSMQNDINQQNSSLD